MAMLVESSLFGRLWLSSTLHTVVRKEPFDEVGDRHTQHVDESAQPMQCDQFIYRGCCDPKLFDAQLTDSIRLANHTSHTCHMHQDQLICDMPARFCSHRKLALSHSYQRLLLPVLARFSLGWLSLLPVVDLRTEEELECVGFLFFSAPLAVARFLTALALDEERLPTEAPSISSSPSSSKSSSSSSSSALRRLVLVPGFLKDLCRPAAAAIAPVPADLGRFKSGAESSDISSSPSER
ncbi:hypothetical protein T265_05989 [Opisthorchis viverrini]|uniref:Uncharacterized protein n=1 Tax=Opisthorchis viverrini TaxID=6198 RepID=A0A074ZHU4_OPIVI|nr:hypothetical protein T265_05989 [Opisthorchis viverrini]KER26858.1 hypothetical protein T265_05989 [Opisthorchis viverrini]